MSDQLSQQITDAIGAHGMWKMRLRTAITTGQSDITPAVAGCSDQCAFGKWLEGRELSADIRAGVPYQVVRRLHADFHRSAGSVLAHALAGRPQQASAAMNGEFTERSEKLVRALAKWKGEVGR